MVKGLGGYHSDGTKGDRFWGCKVDEVGSRSYQVIGFSVFAMLNLRVLLREP
jgi:hypothetical protein